MTRRFWFIVFVLLLGCGFLLGFLLKVGAEKKAVAEILEKYPDNGVPVIDISLNGVSLEEINEGSKDVKYEGNEVTVVDAGRKILEAEGVQVKGRGNSTWEQEKRPYQIKFSKRVDLLGMGKNKKWVLLANYFDRSLVRNDMAMLFAEMLEVKYNTRGRFAEVYFDGNYEGLYYVLPKIEIAKGSVDLRKPEGVLFELDTLHRYSEACYESYLGDCLVLKDAVVKEEDAMEMAAEDFMKDFDEFEMVAEQGNYKRVAELVDVDSFVKYFLVNEFAVNPDAYVSSFYLYRDGASDKICAGPVWDFDLALGNRNWNQRTEEFYLPDGEMARKSEVFTSEGLNADSPISRILYYLEEIPEFHDRITAVFQEKMWGRWMEFNHSFLNTISGLDGALRQNSIKWGLDNYKDEIDLLMEWAQKRYAFFEEIYGNQDSSERLL